MNDERRVTREEWLARCETAFDAGLARPELLELARRWADLVFRLEGGQLQCALDMLNVESQRLGGFGPTNVLANDPNGVQVVDLLSLLSHPCQQCATDRAAWWTRSGECWHREGGQ